MPETITNNNNVMLLYTIDIDSHSSRRQVATNRIVAHNTRRHIEMWKLANNNRLPPHLLSVCGIVFALNKLYTINPMMRRRRMLIVLHCEVQRECLLQVTFVSSTITIIIIEFAFVSIDAWGRVNVVCDFFENYRLLNYNSPFQFISIVCDSSRASHRQTTNCVDHPLIRSIRKNSPEFV